MTTTEIHDELVWSPKPFAMPIAKTQRKLADVQARIPQVRESLARIERLATRTESPAVQARVERVKRELLGLKEDEAAFVRAIDLYRAAAEEVDA